MGEQPPSSNKFLGENLEFKNFLLAFGDSVVRARKIVNLLSVASIAALLGLLNSLSSELNWFPSRQERMRELYHIAVFEDEAQADSLDKENDSVAIYGVRLKNSAYVADHQDTFIKTSNKFNPVDYKKIIELLMANSDTDFITKFDTKLPSPWVQLKFPDYVLQNDKTMKLPPLIDMAKLKQHKDLILHGYNMLCNAQFASKDELNKYIQYMGRSKLENSTFVKMPILGFAFDVNWLIIVSGLGFLIIYYLLYYAFSRERKNILMVFKIAENERVPDIGIYQYMAMQQVFTIPYSIDEVLDDKKHNNIMVDKWPNKLKRFLPKVTWAIPFIIWLGILYYDYKSLKIGEVINTYLVETQFKLAGSIGIIMFLLFCLCYREGVLIDKRWKIQALKIIEARQTKSDDEPNSDGEQDNADNPSKPL
jgi:hypothetical protein